MQTKDFDCSRYWDAGDMGCGELIMKLSRMMKTLKSGEMMEIIASDKGGVEDLPAWSRLTGNDLVLFEPPRYIFKKK